MNIFRQQVEEAAAYIASRLPLRPRIGLVLGTGLGGIADAMEAPVAIPYDDIPHHPVSTVTSHEGRLLCGRWSGQPVLALQGRFHLYEGYTARQISFPIRIMKKLGVEILVLSNAAGGLNPLFHGGDIMLITDHINFTGHNPLIGPNNDEWGPRFPDMTQPYSPRLRELAAKTALAEGLALRQGVYVGVLGPSLETAAETRLLRAAGADAVGMSTIMEVITAVHAGLDVLAFSVVSNVNRPDCFDPILIEDVIAMAEKSGKTLMELLGKILKKL